MPYQEDFKAALLAPPRAILGKNKVSPQFTEHVERLLKRYKTIKIKALKSALGDSNIKELADELARRTSANLLDVRGKMIILSITLEKKNT